jgi:hypothetical protein
LSKNIREGQSVLIEDTKISQFGVFGNDAGVLKTLEKGDESFKQSEHFHSRKQDGDFFIVGRTDAVGVG